VIIFFPQNVKTWTATLTFTFSFHFSSYSYSHPILILLIFILLYLCSSSSIILWSTMSANSSTRKNVTSNHLCYYRRRATIRIARTVRNNGRLFYTCPLPQVSNVNGIFCIQFLCKIEHEYFVLCSKMQINVIFFRGLMKTLMLVQLK